MACGAWQCVSRDLYCDCNGNCSGTRSSTQCWTHQKRKCDSVTEFRYVYGTACNADTCSPCGDYRGSCGSCFV